MKIKLFALAVSGILAGLFMEISLRLLYEPPPDWIEPQVQHLRSPLLGWVLPVNIDGAYTIDAPVRTNSFGLRDDEFPVEKPAGERRILALGDSFTFALGVRFEDLYVQKLERTLNERHSGEHFQVINAGVAGYNTRQELLYLLAEGLDFEPDLITVGFYWNDLYENDAPLPDVRTTPLRDPQVETLTESNHLLPAWLRNPLRRSLLLYTTVTRVKSLIGGLKAPSPDGIDRLQQALTMGEKEFIEPYWRATEQRLLEIAAVAREHDIPVVLIIFPMENQLQHDFPDMAYVEELRRIWSPTGQPFIDLVSAYQEALAAGNNPFLPYDLHPGEFGMQVAADEIYEVIYEQGLLGLQSLDQRLIR